MKSKMSKKRMVGKAVGWIITGISAVFIALYLFFAIFSNTIWGSSPPSWVVLVSNVGFILMIVWAIIIVIGLLYVKLSRKSRK